MTIDAANKIIAKANEELSDHWTNLGNHNLSNELVVELRREVARVGVTFADIVTSLNDTTPVEPPTPTGKKPSDILPDGTVMAPDGTNLRLTAAEKDSRYSTPFSPEIQAPMRMVGGAVVFTCSPDRGHSPGSSFSRSEWREYFNGEEASWTSKGTHTCEAEYSVESHLVKRNQFSIQQRHDANDDVWQVVVDNGKVIEKGSKKVLSETVPARFTVKTVTREKDTDFYFDGQLKFTMATPASSGNYFKAGCYLQTSKAKYGELPTAWAATTIHSLKVTHA